MTFKVPKFRVLNFCVFSKSSFQFSRSGGQVLPIFWKWNPPTKLEGLNFWLLNLRVLGLPSPEIETSEFTKSLINVGFCWVRQFGKNSEILQGRHVVVVQLLFWWFATSITCKFSDPIPILAKVSGCLNGKKALNFQHNIFSKFCLVNRQWYPLISWIIWLCVI